MSCSIYLGTRKGLLVVDLDDSGRPGVPRCVGFNGATVTMVLANELDGTLYAALNHGHFGVKLHRSSDRGQTWEECGVPAIPPAGEGEDPSKAVALSEIWSLENGGQQHPDTLWCGTIPGAVFKSGDRGTTWQLVESLWNRPERREWFGGGKDHSGVHSICVDPRNGDHVRIGISCGGVWFTGDGGKTWSIQTTGMRAEYMPPERQFDGNIQDPHRLVQCPGQPDHFWVQHHNGIFYSSDCCESWTEISKPALSGFGFAVVVDPHDGRRAWFVPAVKDECRVPVENRLAVTRTTDGGQSFDVLKNGLPNEMVWDIVFRHALAIDQTGKCLAMGSTTGSLWTSIDAGATWRHVSAHLPTVYCVVISGL
ncbi:MAG: exo-alpha-sialidase [Planctomyces sp.]|nr:exo-alpha-sialidase [Planctomyces sp.]